jgi:two-component system, OmpR family, sensor kinase
MRGREVLMSLRARLLIGLLAIAALGLLIAGAVTYAEQRSFLQDRVDQQARDAFPGVSHALDEREIDESGFGRRGRGPGGGPGSPTNLPPGTYALRRDGSGRAVGEPLVATRVYGEKAPAAPRWPEDITPNKPVTVDSVGGGDLKYRVVAQATRDQPGTTLIAIPMRDVEQTLHRLLGVEAAVIGGVLLALALLSLMLVRIGLRPLDRIGETAGAIAGGDLSRRVSPATPKTEVGRLGMALNAMLDRLEQAFAERQASENRLRTFLADASHELRTPLASIRGYAELYRIGAARNPADSEKAMRRIEDEAKRMGVLVEDLLRLARLDEVREPAREEVDVSAIARDATEDARTTAPDRSIELTLDGPAKVLGDPLALQQVLANLLGNALAHTPAGTPVEVSVANGSGRVSVVVRDHGPGLPEGDPADLFERFWRAEAGRERGRAGAGLGLAIVAGIVEAHGGEVSAADAAGGGAQFTVALPALR